MTISISPDRVDEIKAKLEAWCNRAKMSHKQLESLIGKLQFTSQFIRAGQVFMAHSLDELRGSPKKGYITLPTHIIQDLKWWQYIMPILNSTKSIYFDVFFEPCTLIYTDTMLVGAGGLCKGYYFHTPFPDFIVQQAHIIAHLELLAFIVAVFPVETPPCILVSMFAFVLLLVYSIANIINFVLFFRLQF